MKCAALSKCSIKVCKVSEVRAPRGLRNPVVQCCHFLTAEETGAETRSICPVAQSLRAKVGPESVSWILDPILSHLRFPMTDPGPPGAEQRAGTLGTSLWGGAAGLGDSPEKDPGLQSSALGPGGVAL